ncbi:MAG: hypothetical protein IJV01_01340 [Bacteroidales bacterium]|nr:hypothetical protein [Bacteroidales bacterium]
MKQVKTMICSLGAVLLCVVAGAQEISTEQAVDLGLSVKWAGYNIDASSPEQYGGFYAWGEIEEKGDKDYVIENYKWCKGTNDSLTKYCYDDFGFEGFKDDKRRLAPEDDVAHVKWGGPWRIPTEKEWRELSSKCTWYYMDYKGKGGFRITGPSGKAIFLPSAGCKCMLGYCQANSGGTYYASTIDSISSFGCFGFYFYPGMKGPGFTGLLRECGRPVRAVCK